MSQNHTGAEDALGYVLTVNSGFGPKLFHPNHLLFSFLCWAALRACGLFGYSGDAGSVIHAINALAGALCGTVLFSIARRIFDDLILAGTVAGALVISDAFWGYSVETDTYILPLLFALLGFRFFLTELGKPLLRSVLPVAVCLGIATLIHQQYVFSFGAFALAYFLIARGPLVVRFYKPAVLLISGAAATLAVYMVVGISVVGLGGFWDVIAWSRGYAANGLWDPPSLASLIKGAIGLARAIFGLDVLFAFDWFYAFAEHAFPDKLLIEERFAAARMSTAALAVATASLAAAGSAAAWLVVGAIADVRKGWRTRRFGMSAWTTTQGASFVLCLSYVGCLGVLAMMWEPLNVEFWIAVLPFVFMLGGHLVIASPRAQLRRVAPLFVACLGAANLVGSILPETDRKSDYWYVSNEALFAELRPGDLLLTEGGYIADTYAAYFGGPGVTVVRTGSTPVAEIARIVEAHRSRVLISSWAFSPPPALLRTRQFQHWDHAALERLYAAYKPHLKPLLQTEAQTVWVLECSKPATRKCVAASRE
jgi:hypothetical protein